MSELLDGVIECVKGAAEIMRDTSFTVDEKGEKENLLTTNDTKIQKYLYEKLGELLPSSGFFGEEDVTSFREREYVWIVDPIDGTANYSRGIQNCAISVGLERSGELILGVVYCVFSSELFYAEAGCGAYLNGKRIKTSDKPFEKGLYCTALSLYKKSLAEICINIMRDVYSECMDIRRFGSAAAELCYLAAGRCELYFEIRVFPWDFAAAAVILTEAGGKISSLTSQAPSLRSPTPIIAANNAENHEKMLYHVNKYIKEVPYSG